MILKVKKCKYKSFLIFYRLLKNINKFPWTRNKIEGLIPNRLLINFSKNKIKMFYYKKLREHTKLINQTYNLYQAIIKEYGTFITGKIYEYTKLPWRYKEVIIIPSVLCALHKNIILSSLPRPCKSKEYFVQCLIHELIHINAIYVPNLKYPIDSNEIVTTLLENKIINDLNKTFCSDFDSRWYYLKKLGIEKDKSSLIKIGKNTNSFCRLIKEVDSYLLRNNYNPKYFSKPKR